MVTIKEWTTRYPTSLDTITQMPQLINGKDKSRVSHWHSVRDSIFQLQQLVGSDSLESGSLRERSYFLEDGYSDLWEKSSWLTDGYNDLWEKSSWLTDGYYYLLAHSGGSAHALGGLLHTADTFVNLNSKVSDADLVSTDMLSIYAEKVLLDSYIVAPVDPTDGYVLVWNGGWQPTPACGDLSGSYIEPTVARIQGRNVSSDAYDGYALMWNGGADEWRPMAAGGDLFGTCAEPTVVKIWGRDVSDDAYDGYALVWNEFASEWQPTIPYGDLSGTYAEPTVVRLQGRDVSSDAYDGYALVWNDGANEWQPTISRGGIPKSNISIVLNEGTGEVVDQSVGNFSLNPSDYAIANVTVEFRFIVTAFITDIGFTGSIELYNLTDSSSVDILSFSEMSATKKSSSVLSLLDGENMYEVRIKCVGSPGIGDMVVCRWAGFEITVVS